MRDMGFTFNVGDFFQYIMLACLVELCDKTFLLVAAFAMWSPRVGVRQCAYATTEMMVLAASCGSALVLRTFLLFVGVNPFKWDGFCTVGSCLLLACLGVLLFMDLRRVLNPKFEESLTALFDSEVGRYGGTATAGTPSGGTAAGGTTTGTNSEPDAAEPVPDEIPQEVSADVVDMLPDWMTKDMLKAFWLYVVPCAVVFLVEADDRSETYLELLEMHRYDLLLGCGIGFVLMCYLAVGVGACCKAYVGRAKWVLLIVMAILVILFCISLRDVAVRLLLGHLPLTTSFLELCTLGRKSS
mmetsp:Transcript_955/g.2731  ORF Transcript_955/g.2731 Transcript_955/m.2731 type:complete len:299 (-) Transcript_955:131-1027(-)